MVDLPTSLNEVTYRYKLIVFFSLSGTPFCKPYTYHAQVVGKRITFPHNVKRIFEKKLLTLSSEIRITYNISEQSVFLL